MKIDKPGIYRGIETADYFADPAPEPSLSQSICKLLLERSPWHVKHAHPRLMLAPLTDEDVEEYKKPQAIGNAAHAIMIGRGKTLEIIKANDFKGGEARKLRNAAFAAGKSPILEKHLVIASDIVASGMRQLKAHEDHDAFTNGHGEVALIWQDDGIWCRALVDWLHDDLRTVDDYKTSAMSMAPHVIGLRAENAGWHIQAAFIERGLEALDPKGTGRRRYRFIAQEQDGEPYALTSMHMSEHWLTMGRKKVAAAMSLWRAAMATNYWRGYGTRAVIPEYPGFKETQWLDREINEFSEPPAIRGPMLKSLMGG
jgi:hypothetical protein